MANQFNTRPRTMNPGSYEPSEKKVQAIKDFNNMMRYIQGQSTLVAANASTPQSITLLAPGKMLLGITLIPSLKTIDMSSITLDFKVNNNVLLTKVNCENLNPLSCQSFIFFPLPQPLVGNDQIDITYNSLLGAAVNIVSNIYYIPR